MNNSLKRIIEKVHFVHKICFKTYYASRPRFKKTNQKNNIDTENKKEKINKHYYLIGWVYIIIENRGKIMSIICIILN